MTTPVAHCVLRKAGGGELVVMADFGSAGRPSATFTELVSALKTEHNMWETMPPPYGQEAGMTGPDHVARWARDARDSALLVRAVMGFCSGSVYAAALVEQISRWQQSPRLLLIDPDLAERHMVIDHYERFVRARLSALVTPTEVDAAVRAGRDADAAAADALDLATSLDMLCQTVMAPALVQGGLGRARGVELAEVFASYLYWLAAGSHLDPRGVWATATALNSATDGFGLNAFPPEQREGLVGRVINVDVPHLELMRSPEVARTVDEWLS